MDAHASSPEDAEHAGPADDCANDITGNRRTFALTASAAAAATALSRSNGHEELDR